MRWLRLCVALGLQPWHAIAKSFTPAEAQSSWSNALKAAPEPASAVQNFCTAVRISDQNCADFFLSPDPIQSFASNQAAINCMSQMEASQAQSQALLAALGADTLKLSQYASGGSKPEYQYRDGKWQRNDFSPSDIDRAMKNGKEQGIELGTGVYNVLSAALTLSEWTLEFALTKRFPVLEGTVVGDAISLGTTAFMPDKNDFVEGWGVDGAIDGARNPEKYTQPTGVCERGKDCVDSNGNPYPNKDPKEEFPEKDEEDPAGFDKDIEGVDTDPILISDGDDAPSEDDPEPEEVVNIDPDAPSASEVFMSRCMKQEAMKITRQLGTIKSVDDSGNSEPVTEEEKRKEAEDKLRRGACDKQYYGEEKCNKWKRDRQVNPMDPQVLEYTQAAIEQNRICGSLKAYGSCEKGYDEIRKRYVLDGPLDLIISTSFSPRQGKLQKLVPIRFPDPDGSMLPEVTVKNLRGPFEVPVTFTAPHRNPPVIGAVPTREPLVVTLVDKWGDTITIKQPSTSTPKPLVITGEDGKRTTLKPSVTTPRGPVRTPTFKVPKLPKLPKLPKILGGGDDDEDRDEL